MHPLRVLTARGDGRIILNRGGDLVRAGEVFEVDGAPENLKDPATGLSIRVDGDFLGAIQVERVQPRYSEARFVRGEGQDRIDRSGIVRSPSPNPDLEPAPLF